ncbi:MAG: nucleoside hydrolase [bacterium]|nr:nucleoside hydrolase [bacterium]
MQKIIAYTIISDPGVDDILALLLLKKLSPASKNTLISTFGNVPEKYTAQNAKEFIQNFAPNWNFMSGSKSPLKTLEHPWPTYFHGSDGIWNTHSKNLLASKEKIKQLKKYPKNSHIISLGPTTDVFKLSQEVSLKEITLMGGAFDVSGNETSYAETNIAFDPDATLRIFNSLGKTNIKIIPLDVTKKVFWNFEKIEKIPEFNESYRWVKNILLAWFENYGLKNNMPFDLHDPLAIYAMFFPNDLVWEKTSVKIITQGEKRGQTKKIQNKLGNCEVAIGLKKDDTEIADDIFNMLFNTQ